MEIADFRQGQQLRSYNDLIQQTIWERLSLLGFQKDDKIIPFFLLVER